jgi:peptidoglycan/xylan/chitin deacetylase (PgdA/CDA1 family)
MDRRQFLEILAAGVITAATGIAAVEILPEVLRGPTRFGFGKMGAPLPAATPDHHVYPTAVPYLFNEPQLSRVPIPFGTMNAIHGQPGVFALTVDDGISSDVVREYVRFADRTGMRLTFFVTGQYPSWTDNIKQLRPLVESGQIQLANHTWTHPSLVKASNGQISNELGQAHDFLLKNYGVDATPYFRPPFGNHDARVNSVAASLGYTSPVMWMGTLSDAGQITPEQLKSFADKWIGDQRIVIGHANFPAVTECFDYISQLIIDRKLQPVTLNDLYQKA